MAGRASHVQHNSAILKFSEVAPDAVRAHVRAIVESPALKGSRRSQEFLRFVVEKALDGRYDDLKERTLGVELFGRIPSYDTGTDAIVRVTACDVRRRLLQYYSAGGDHSGYRIELPPGSYIPEFQNAREPLREILPAPEMVAVHAEVPATEVAATLVPAIAPEPKGVRRPAIWRWSGYAACAAALLAILWFGLRPVAGGAFKGVLPWSAVTAPHAKTHLIFCDPEIVTIQRLLDYTVTLSDYANRRYWPVEMQPEARRLMDRIAYRGASVAAVDAAAATKISSLAARGAGNLLETHPARTVRLTDFNTDDNFVLFGSPRSNPWVALFQEQLDFRFEFDNAKKAEFIRNVKPQAGESATYIPTAEGWATGQAYAIIAMVKNPNHDGHVLILAGSNAEATEAAGSFATSLPLLAATLKKYGIDSQGRSQPFEVLLRVSAMAGSPSTFEVIACHRLSR